MSKHQISREAAHAYLKQLALLFSREGLQSKANLHGNVSSNAAEAQVVPVRSQRLQILRSRILNCKRSVNACPSPPPFFHFKDKYNKLEVLRKLGHRFLRSYKMIIMVLSSLKNHEI